VKPILGKAFKPVKENKSKIVFKKVTSNPAKVAESRPPLKVTSPSDKNETKKKPMPYTGLKLTSSTSSSSLNYLLLELLNQFKNARETAYKSVFKKQHQTKLEDEKRRSKKRSPHLKIRDKNEEKLKNSKVEEVQIISEQKKSLNLSSIHLFKDLLV